MYIRRIAAIEKMKDNNLVAFSKLAPSKVKNAIKGGHIGEVDPYVLLPA
jgi:hypothetical protein